MDRSHSTAVVVFHEQIGTASHGASHIGSGDFGSGQIGNVVAMFVRRWVCGACKSKRHAAIDRIVNNVNDVTL
jgi:hypothetical protein